MKVKPPCLHCGRYYSIVARGLCKACHGKPGIREQYPELRGRPKTNPLEWSGRVMKKEEKI